MHALLALAVDPMIAMVLAFGGDVVLAAASGSQGLVNAIRNFLGPLFLLAIGLAAMSFLFQRQITQFLQFMALAVGIAVLFYFPGVVEGVARFFAAAF